MDLLGTALILSVMSVWPDDVVFRSGIALVRVDTEVHQEGRILTGLTESDFAVFDENVKQRLLYFSLDEEPLDLILLFDISSSMRPVVEKVAAAARQSLLQMRHGDRVCVMAFNTGTHELLPFTDDLDAVERTIQTGVLQQPFGGSTFLQSAIDHAALRFRGEPKTRRRRAVLVITDNFGTRTRRESTIVRDYWESDALLSGLIVRSEAGSAFLTATNIAMPTGFLFQAGINGVVDKTGGDVIRVKDGGAGFQESMHRIRSRYSLYYAAPAAKPGSVRSVRVTLSPEGARRFPGARVRARKGYLVPAEQGLTSK